MMLFSCIALTLSGSCFPTPVSGSDEKQWEISNYRIRIHLAVDTAARPQPHLEQRIAQHLKQRLYATSYPLLSVEISLATGPLRHALVHHIDDLPQKTEDQPSLGFDKEMYLAVATTAEGTQITCREVDRYTSTWGPALTRNVRQAWTVSQQCFDLIQATFSPIAKVRRVTDDDNHVLLLFKGSNLPLRTDETMFAQAGTVYRPLKIRTNPRAGSRPESISQVPWTYLTLEEMDARVGRCLIHAGIRKPFGVRRRGRVEHLAIALRQPPQATRVRFYARHDKSQPLVGYEVFQRTDDSQPSNLLGLTDNQGWVLVPSGGQSVTTLLLRSDGKLLAKLPIARGASTVIEVPIADDTARLNAQATLTSLREQLIDLVARRNILITRVRERIDSDELDQAKMLLSQLDELPGRSQFAQLLSTAERKGHNRSNEPRIQKTIEKMFADTRKLLGRFLSTKQISELQSELNEARQRNPS